jgi:hypothetical protein
MKKTNIGSFRVFRMVNDPRFKKAMDASCVVNREYDIPYLAGYSKDRKTFYIDRHLPTKFPGDGNVLPHLLIHEKVEKALEDIFKLRYQDAHKIALHFEHEAVTKSGISWDKYSRFMDKWIKLDGHEKLTKVPKDLDLKPYEDERDNRLLFKLRKMEHISNIARDHEIIKNKGGH